MPHPTRRRLPRFLRRAKYPVWSVGTVTAIGLVVAGLTAGLVYGLGKRSVFVETELTLAIIAACLFLFLAVGLYRGARVRRKDLPSTAVKGVSLGEAWDMTPSDVFGVGGDVGDAAGGDELGCLAVVAGFILAIVVGILLIVLLWILLNLGIVLWVFLAAAASWVFYLALRQVFARSRVCRGNLGKSVGYALLYTALYTGWLFALVWIAHGLFGPRLGP